LILKSLAARFRNVDHTGPRARRRLGGQVQLCTNEALAKAAVCCGVNSPSADVPLQVRPVEQIDGG
jgi:hypothetical protein